MIFVDTSALYEIVDKQSEKHTAASNIFTELVRSNHIMSTTNYVVHELLALAQRRLGMDAVDDLVGDLLPSLQVAFVDEALHRRGVDLLLTERRRRLSLTDCTSIAFMRRVRIHEAFAFDSDFERFGIRMLHA